MHKLPLTSVKFQLLFIWIVAQEPLAAHVQVCHRWRFYSYAPPHASALYKKKKVISRFYIYPFDVIGSKLQLSSDSPHRCREVVETRQGRLEESLWNRMPQIKLWRISGARRAVWSARWPKPRARLTYDGRTWLPFLTAFWQDRQTNRDTLRRAAR